MIFLKRNNWKCIVLISVIIIFLFVMLFTFVNRWQQGNNNKAINSRISGIIERIDKRYPDVSEDEILEILKSDGHINNSFLAKYGYSERSTIIETYKEESAKQAFINTLILMAFGATLIIAFIIYISNQNNKIDEIKKYINAVSNKDYSLDISDNGEDELSKLRNELYKITVMLKESAEISIKEKTQLSDSIADISHQIKTPITSIRIMLDNIKENPQMDEATKNEFINDISNQVDWISSLVISLLKLARLDAGVIELNRQEIKVEELVQNVVRNLAIWLEVKNVSVEVNIPDGAVFFGDYNWQLEALTNIVKNSIEHSRENSKIYIIAESNNFFLKIIVKDEGNGILKEDIKHIFDRFYKSKNSSEDSIGIGLSLAKSIIEKDNGYIEVTSKLEKGTEFEIKYMRGWLHKFSLKCWKKYQYWV